MKSSTVVGDGGSGEEEVVEAPPQSSSRRQSQGDLKTNGTSFANQAFSREDEEQNRATEMIDLAEFCQVRSLQD